MFINFFILHEIWYFVFSDISKISLGQLTTQNCSALINITVVEKDWMKKIYHQKNFFCLLTIPSFVFVFAVVLFVSEKSLLYWWSTLNFFISTRLWVLCVVCYTRFLLIWYFNCSDIFQKFKKKLYSFSKI